MRNTYKDMSQRIVAGVLTATSFLGLTSCVNTNKKTESTNETTSSVTMTEDERTQYGFGAISNSKGEQTVVIPVPEEGMTVDIKPNGVSTESTSNTSSISSEEISQLHSDLIEIRDKCVEEGTLNADEVTNENIDSLTNEISSGSLSEKGEKTWQTLKNAAQKVKDKGKEKLPGIIGTIKDAYENEKQNFQYAYHTVTSGEAKQYFEGLPDAIHEISEAFGNKETSSVINNGKVLTLNPKGGNY